MPPQSRGFSLLEILVTLAIVALLMTMAYPSYRNYVLQAHRSDAKTALLNLADHMESYFAQNNTYAGATLANLGVAALSPNGFYQLTLTASSVSYVLQAMPIGSQANDIACGSFKLDQLGQKSITGPDSVAMCW